MFGFLARWFRGGQRVFSFRVPGYRRRWLDPIPACAAVESLCPELDDLLDLLRSDLPPVLGPAGESLKSQRAAAGRKLVEVSRQVFGLPPFSDASGRPSGVTDAAAVGVLREFIAWLEDAAFAASPSSSSSGSGSDSPGGSTTAPSPASTTVAGESPASGRSS